MFIERSSSNVSVGKAVGEAVYGTKEFFTDFFTTDIMNHCEFLKYIMTQLGKHDESLLQAILEQLARPVPITPIKPFYRDHQNLTKNPVNIASAYVSLKTLRTHNFNIYEQAFLDGESTSAFSLSLFTICLQYAIFAILLFNNLPAYMLVLENPSPSVWVLAVSTTFFFGKACYNQYTAAAEFKGAFADIGRRFSLCQPSFERQYLMMLCSTLGNQVLAVLVPFFNVYFILLAEDPNDAVLNSLALYFILELDEMVVHDWDASRVLDELAINAHDFIMEEPEDKSDTLVVTKRGSPEFMSGLRGFCPKCYPVYPRRQEDGSWSVVIYHRASADGTYFEKNEYILTGMKAEELVESLKEFECFYGGGHYADIHD